MNLIKLTVLLLTFLSGQSALLSQDAPPAPTDGRTTLSLDGPGWQMEGIRPGQGRKEGFHEHFGEVCPSTYNWNGARVPGDVYTDLWRAGEIDDPHYGRNGIRAKWVMEKEWWYRCQFGVDEAWKGRRVRLVFDGVDYACDVWLNGKHLGSHEGMFSPFEFDVSRILQYGPDKRANGLVVRLAPPPRSYRKIAGRKFPWHGDYWRTIAPIGIWKSVRLEATGPLHISNVYPTSRINDNGSATVNIQVTLENGPDKPLNSAQVAIKIRGKNVKSTTYHKSVNVSLNAHETQAELSIDIPDAKPWWPWDLGKPNLYTVETIVTDANGAVSDQVGNTFGIREIRMTRNPGYSEKEVHYPWTVEINGKPIFLRSANWGGPPDIFYGRNSPDIYRKLIQQAREANINNLRIFGWHPPEKEIFYRLCDELGITVWQDLIPLASVSLPRDDAFRKATHGEAVAVMKTLRNHPSLVLLEGGEEMLYGSQNLEHNARFLIDLEDAIRPHTNLPYVPTSPLNWPPTMQKLGKAGKKDSAHTHALFYAMGRQLLEDYIASWDYAAIPEFAISSAPCVESIRKFIPPEEVWPPGPSWGYHWADLDTFRALNVQVLGDERTDSLENFVEATQIAQGTIFQWGIEHMRRRKPKSSALSICHFITYAPDMKWGIVDYYQTPKLSYDFVKRAYQPLLVSLATPKRRWMPGETFRGRIWVVNDLYKDFMDTIVEVYITDAGGDRLFHRSCYQERIGSNSSKEHNAIEWKVKGQPGDTFQVSLTLYSPAGDRLSHNYYDLLVGDQEQARKRCREMAEKLHKARAPFPTADYYRFFPALSGQENASQIKMQTTTSDQE